LGCRYIEGTWIQWADEPGSKKGLSIIRIEPDHEYFVVNGIHFVVAGERFDEFGKTFRIKPIEFKWPELRIYYSTEPIDKPGESPDMEGVGSYTFVSHGRPPTTFEGKYFYGGLPGQVSVKGRKATAAEVQVLGLMRGDRWQELIKNLLM
jgi:hypothetical protein